MTNLQRISSLNAEIRRLLNAEYRSDAPFDPNDPLNDMWFGVERISAGLDRVSDVVSHEPITFQQIRVETARAKVKAMKANLAATQESL